MSKYFGDKKFYKMVCSLALPIVIQNFISNFVSFLDNIMVGRIGTEQMSGVAIIGNMIFIFYLALFGGFSGAGIFSAQFFGKGDQKSVAHTMRYKFYLAAVLLAAAFFIFIRFDEPLIRLFLSKSSDGVGDIEKTLQYSKDYLRVILIGLVPYAVSQVYATTLRETGCTVLPMAAGVTAVFVNLFFNYVLIFGHFGAKAMGVVGAAIATNISRFVELAIVLIATHAQSDRHPFIKSVYKGAKIPLPIVKSVTIKGMPLLLNEVMWSLGMVALLQSYSTRGLAVVAASNMTSTVSDLFSIVFFAIGNAISIVIGPMLGAGEIEKAKDSARKMITLSVMTCFVIGMLFILAAPYIPLIYNTDESVRVLATKFMTATALVMPINAFNHSCYFTIRTGGKTFITMLFDSVFTWVVMIPLAYILTRFTSLNIVTIYYIVLCSEVIKSVIGFAMVKSGTWAKNMVERIGDS
ncbi:MAG: MATE family efflux transporter [Acutalibacteraceae bacterium]|nr:MATE family efflux transporter [Oscillospiraceae bacterium]